MVRLSLFFAFVLTVYIESPVSNAQTIIANHLCTDITKIPSQWIDSARSKLHIAYGHTSHGSQVIDGMTGLVDFANGGGKGLSLPNNTFVWNNGGTGGALDLRDYAMGGDVGYYPDWVNNTRNYLGVPNADGRGSNYPEVNVIIWSWCGQVSGKYANGTLVSEFLDPMNQLEQDYPNVNFVYMTGHLDHGDDFNNKAANDSIRRYCNNESKILFDFSDIESYNPDGNYFQYADDACNYYSSQDDYESDGNWAEEWRALHTENVDWYNCSSAHSDPLNANQKAYAIWWLWARLAGWDGVLPVQMTSFTALVQGMNTELHWNTATEINNYGFEAERRAIGTQLLANNQQLKIGNWNKINFISGAGTCNSPNEYSYTDTKLSAGRYEYRLKQIDLDGSFKYSQSVEVEILAPNALTLFQNYPNPFNPTTTIEFALAEDGFTSLKVFDILGREVITLVDENLRAGIIHQATFNASKLSTGMYFYRLQTKNNSVVKSLLLLK
jgi:hypothetical protein